MLFRSHMLIPCISLFINSSFFQNVDFVRCMEPLTDTNSATAPKMFFFFTGLVARPICHSPGFVVIAPVLWQPLSSLCCFDISTVLVLTIRPLSRPNFHNTCCLWSGNFFSCAGCYIWFCPFYFFFLARYHPFFGHMQLIDCCWPKKPF